MADPATTPVDALIPAMTLLAAGGAAALASKALKLSPIVGYLLVGVLIGPHAFGLIDESPTTHLLAELGVVFLLIFASSLGNGSDGMALALNLARAAGLAVVAFVIAFAAGRYVMGPVLRILARTRNQEAFTAVTLLLVLGAASGTALLGLSLTLGAFLAGLAVSGTAFRHQVQMETGPFRGLLLSFFFMSVGLSVDLGVLAQDWPVVLLIAAGILVTKTMFGFVAARLNKWSNPGSVQIAFLLAQGSEFTLVMLSILAMSTNAVPPVIDTIAVAAIAISLAVAPFWAAAGMQLSRKIATVF